MPVALAIVQQLGWIRCPFSHRVRFRSHFILSSLAGKSRKNLCFPAIREQKKKRNPSVLSIWVFHLMPENRGKRSSGREICLRPPTFPVSLFVLHCVFLILRVSLVLIESRVVCTCWMGGGWWVVWFGLLEMGGNVCFACLLFVLTFIRNTHTRAHREHFLFPSGFVS